MVQKDKTHTKQIYLSRKNVFTKTRTILGKDVIAVSIYYIESVSVVNDVFNTINKYAN